jgi:catechol 2,3-dioxygenase-like lactoylglutathione lyase family enzyme
MRIDRIDHLVLTVVDIDRPIAFYVDVLGMTEQTFGPGRKALTFGTSKINLHDRGRELEPKAAAPTSGSADVCLIAAAARRAPERRRSRRGGSWRRRWRPGASTNAAACAPSAVVCWATLRAFHACSFMDCTSAQSLGIR